MLRSLLGRKKERDDEPETAEEGPKSSPDGSSPGTTAGRGWSLLKTRFTDGHMAGGGGVVDDAGSSSSPTSHGRRSIGRVSFAEKNSSKVVTTGLVWVPPVDFAYGRYISMQEFDAKWINAAKSGAAEVSGTFSYSIRRGPMHEDKQKEYYRQGTNRERPWFTQQRQQGRDDGSEGAVSMSVSPVWCQLAVRLQSGGKLMDAQDEQLLRTPVLPAADPDRCSTADNNCRDDEGAVYTVRVLFKHDGKQQHEDTGDAHLHKVPYYHNNTHYSHSLLISLHCYTLSTHAPTHPHTPSYTSLTVIRLLLHAINTPYHTHRTPRKSTKSL